MIYIIITTCIHNKEGIINNYHRELRYIECINKLLDLLNDDKSIKPIIVENNGKRETYLDNFVCDIMYTNNNKINCLNKAENELLDIKEVIKKYNIQDDDTIIKLTGRYKLLNLNFINVVKEYINTYDAFVKFFNVCTQQYVFDDCVLGLFAIKCKYLKKFNYKFIKSPECEFADYVRKKISNVLDIKVLNLECCFADDLRILNI